MRVGVSYSVSRAVFLGNILANFLRVFSLKTEEAGRQAVTTPIICARTNNRYLTLVRYSCTLEVCIIS